MKGRNQHITERSDGNWQVKGEGASRASFVTTTQSEAIKLGRRICSSQESELIIHRRDGRIRAKDSHGHDPFPPGIRIRLRSDSGPVTACPLSQDRLQHCGEMRAWG